jgi:hypothetical protein
MTRPNVGLRGRWRMYYLNMRHMTSCNSEPSTPFIEHFSRGFLISWLNRKGMSRCFAMIVESRIVGISIMEFCHRRFWNGRRHIKQLTMGWVQRHVEDVPVSCIRNRFHAISGDGKGDSSAILASKQGASGVAHLLCGRGGGGSIDWYLQTCPHLYSVLIQV